MNKIIKIKNNTFKYKNIKGRIEYIEEDIYIYIGNKIFKFKKTDIIRLKYKGIIFKFNLNENIVKIHKRQYYCNHDWNFENGICKICGKKCDWFTDDCIYFTDMKTEDEIDDKKKLFGILVISNLVEIINNNAFWDCSKLTSIIIPNTVKTIGNNAFQDCFGLTLVTIPDSVETIGVAAFNSCSRLTSITIGDSVETIGEAAFYNCSKLTSITIGDSVETIGNSVFWGCSNLININIIYNSELSISKINTFLNVPSYCTILIKCDEDISNDIEKQNEYQNKFKDAGYGGSFEW